MQLPRNLVPKRLRFTAAVSATAVFQTKRLITLCSNRGRRLYSTARLFNPFDVAVVDLDQPGTVSGQRAAYASGPTLRNRRDDEQRGSSPYDAKCNVAEIGAVNMGEIGAVRKRSR